MPRIDPYQQQTSTPRPVVQTVDPGPGRGVGTAAIAQALGAVARDQERLKAFERKKAEERAAVWANEQVMGVRSRWVEELMRRQESASEDAAGFALQTLTDFDAEADTIIEQAPTEASRHWLKERLGAVRLGLQQNALVFEAQRGVEFKVNGLTRSVDQARIAAEFNPDDFATLAAEQVAAIAASGLDEKTQATLVRDTQAKLADASVRGMIRRDPYAALKELNDEQSQTLSVRALSFDQRQLLRNQAETEIRRLEAERKANLTQVRQALTDQLADIRAAAIAGMPIDNIPSRDALVAAFGQHEGEQRYKQALGFADLAPKLATLHQSSVNEIAETIQSFKPTQVEGAADQLAMLGVVQQQAGAILREREADAGGYLVTHASRVREAWNAFQQADEEQSGPAADEYLRAVRAEKERLGIQSLDMLPESYADALVARLSRPQGAETLAVAMASEAQRWGEHWPSVYRQLSKKLPDAALVIGSGIPKRAADTLALMSQKTPNELKVLIPAGTTMNDVETQVIDELADFESTFGPEGATILAAVRSSVVKTAIGYMASGSSVDDAIEQAATDIANSRYTFQSFRGQPYRTPIEFDADLIDEGATFFLRGYEQPAGTVQVPAGVEENEVLAQATANIRRTGYWRTAPDESGLRLYVGNAAVPGADGRPVQLTWDELEDLARRAAAARAAEEERKRRAFERASTAPGVHR